MERPACRCTPCALAGGPCATLPGSPCARTKYRQMSTRRRWSDGASCRRRPSRKSVDRRLHRTHFGPFFRSDILPSAIADRWSKKSSTTLSTTRSEPAGLGPPACFNDLPSMKHAGPFGYRRPRNRVFLSACQGRGFRPAASLRESVPHSPAIVISSRSTEPQRTLPRSSVSLPTCRSLENMSRRFPAIVISSTGWAISPWATQNPAAPRE